MKHIIDIDAWERRDNYGFFRSFVNSWYSVTTEIDCTEASAARAAKRSFSFIICMLWCVRPTRSMNSVKDRQRNGLFSRPGGHHFSDSRSWKDIYTVRIPYHEDFERFYAEAYALITNIPRTVATLMELKRFLRSKAITMWSI